MADQYNAVEEWREIPGFDGHYDVSSYGNVRRSFNAPERRSTTRGRVLIPDRHNSGYYRLSLHVHGKCHRIFVHRLVSRAFLGLMPRQHVNHKDGDKHNNALSNLECVTPQENVRHAWANNLCHARQGELHGGAKLTDSDIRKIRAAASRGVAQRSIAAVFNVTETTVSYIVLNKTWTHVLPEVA